MNSADYEQIGEEIGESYLELAERYGHDKVILGIVLLILFLSRTMYCFLY